MSAQPTIHRVFLHQKTDLLLHLLAASPEARTVVYARSRETVHALRALLAEEGIAVDSLHGGKKPEAREQVLLSFRDRQVTCLVTPEGLIAEYALPEDCRVIYYDFHTLEEDYLSRLGEVKSVTTLVTQEDHVLFIRLKELLEGELEERQAENFAYDRNAAAPPRRANYNKTGSKPLQHKKPKLKNKGPRRKTGRTRKR